LRSVRGPPSCGSDSASLPAKALLVRKLMAGSQLDRARSELELSFGSRAIYRLQVFGESPEIPVADIIGTADAPLATVSNSIFVRVPVALIAAAIISALIWPSLLLADRQLHTGRTWSEPSSTSDLVELQYVAEQSFPLGSWSPRRAVEVTSTRGFPMPSPPGCTA
jgi:hypothetical protein